MLAFCLSAVAKKASEARLLEDRTTVLVVASGCGLYRLNPLKRDNPEAQSVRHRRA
jgi:hypothetical protein